MSRLPHTKNHSSHIFNNHASTSQHSPHPTHHRPPWQRHHQGPHWSPLGSILHHQQSSRQRNRMHLRLLLQSLFSSCRRHWNTTVSPLISLCGGCLFHYGRNMHRRSLPRVNVLRITIDTPTISNMHLRQRHHRH